MLQLLSHVLQKPLNNVVVSLRVLAVREVLMKGSNSQLSAEDGSIIHQQYNRLVVDLARFAGLPEGFQSSFNLVILAMLRVVSICGQIKTKQEGIGIFEVSDQSPNLWLRRIYHVDMNAAGNRRCFRNVELVLMNLDQVRKSGLIVWVQDPRQGLEEIRTRC